MRNREAAEQCVLRTEVSVLSWKMIARHHSKCSGQVGKNIQLCLKKSNWHRQLNRVYFLYPLRTSSKHENTEILIAENDWLR
jgi:hypothetical protein